MTIPNSVEELEDFIRSSQKGSMTEALGVTFQKLSADEVSASMPVSAATRQPLGFLHGGASLALAESVASVGGWLNVDVKKSVIFGAEINANHIRSVKKGSVEAIGTPVHIGRTTQVWDVRILNEDKKLVCISRCTLAVVDRLDVVE